VPANPLLSALSVSAMLCTAAVLEKALNAARRASRLLWPADQATRASYMLAIDSAIDIAAWRDRSSRASARSRFHWPRAATIVNQPTTTPPTTEPDGADHRGLKSAYHAARVGDSGGVRRGPHDRARRHRTPGRRRVQRRHF
jgi:hypothetical protein